MAVSRIVLLTGPIGVGKTTIAERVVGLARMRGLSCTGILSPSIRDTCGEKVGIWALDVRSGDRRVQARTDHDLRGPRIGPYSFDAAVLSWEVHTIELGLQSDSAMAPAHAGRVDAGESGLVVVDEIGKLELWQGVGLAPVLPRLAVGGARRALIIVRESLLEELQERLRAVLPVVCAVTEETRDAAPSLVLRALLAPHA